MKTKLNKRNFLLLALFPVLITSLWVNNVYILFIFSVICWIILPYKKWWDGISVPLLFFSFFYAAVIVYKGEIESKFLLITYIMAPTAFYRLGRFLMKTNQVEATRQKMLIYIIGLYLLPLFLLTAQDMALTGLINDSRQMLMDLGNDDSMAATLYGLMASAGIGLIGTAFAKQQNKWLKMGLILVAALSLLSVIHLVNRTGLVICAACLFVGFALSTRMNVSKMLPILLIFIIVGVFLSESGILGSDVSEAYADRDDRNDDANSANAGGRTELWLDAIGNLFVSPLGWKLDRYAHNLWLDIARVVGWLAFFPFVKATIVYMMKVKTTLRNGGENGTLMLLLSVNVAMLLNAAVEPVIDGSPLFFSLLMMIWGMTVTSGNFQDICQE